MLVLIFNGVWFSYCIMVKWPMEFYKETKWETISFQGLLFKKKKKKPPKPRWLKTEIYCLLFPEAVSLNAKYQ